MGNIFTIKDNTFIKGYISGNWSNFLFLELALKENREQKIILVRTVN